MMQSIVDVFRVMGVYNGSPKLGSTADSILSRGGVALELFVMNDVAMTYLIASQPAGNRGAHSSVAFKCGLTVTSANELLDTAY